MVSKVSFSQAIIGYELAATARRLSSSTIRGYKDTFRKFAVSLETDPPFAAITRDQIIQFLAEQGEELSNKTLLNYHVGLSALYTWAIQEGLVSANLLHKIDRPRPQQMAIVPLNEFEVRALLGALTYSSSYARPGKQACRHRLPEADRNIAIYLLMLDTGARASEVCSLPIRRVDLKSPNKSIIVHGKGNKDRQIPISARTGQVLWKYLATRPDARLTDPLFATDSGRALDRCNLRDMLANAGKKAGVQQGVHPHLLRHTFAINYLRNGGDIYTLQAILGHTSLDMVKRYLQIAQVDLEGAHRRASPVDHWKL